MSTQENSIDVVCDLYAQAGNKLREFSEVNRKIQVLLGQIDFNKVIASGPPEITKEEPAVKSEKTTSKAKKVTSAPRSTVPLREVILNVIKAANKDGLRVSDVIKNIKAEGSWQTTGDLANMVNSTVYNLRKAGFLVRDDEKKTYKIVK